jgi:DNA primase
VAGQGDIERVREATDLVAIIGEHVALRPRGREHVGLCPFHDDHSPSFAVVTHKGNAFYKCHSCGAAGDAFQFVIEYHKLSFPEALRLLAERAGIELQAATGTAGGDRGPTHADLREISDKAVRYFRRALADPGAGSAARAILADRCIDEPTAEQFALGLAPPGFASLADRLRGDAREAAVAVGLLKRRPDGSVYDAFRNRLVFPIMDELGRPIAFGARRIDPEDEPKYLNSAENPLFSKSRTLYGLHLAKRSIIDRREAIVVEGYTDVIACHRAGVTNVVGTLGTALTREHAKVLSRLCDTVVLVFDGDEAGQKAADRGVEAFFSQPVDVRICVLPDDQDPDDLLRRDDGADALRDAVERSQEALAFKVSRFAGQLAGETTLAGREKLMLGFLQELADLGFGSMQGVRRRWVVSRLAELLCVSVADVERAMPQGRRSAAGAPTPAPAEQTLPMPVPTGLRRSRRLAEHGLLAVLVSEPTVGLSAITVDDRSCTVTELFDPNDFRDPAAQMVAGFVLGCLQRGQPFTVDQMLQALEDQAARDLGSRLFFEGEQAVGADSERAAEALQDAVEALRRCREDERYREQAATRPQDVDELARLLEHRRRCGDIASAIGQGVRN